MPYLAILISFHLNVANLHRCATFERKEDILTRSLSRDERRLSKFIACSSMFMCGYVIPLASRLQGLRSKGRISLKFVSKSMKPKPVGAFNSVPPSGPGLAQICH